MTAAPHPPGPAGIVTLAAANAAIAAVIHDATARGIAVAVVITAPSGDPIASARMDGVPPMAAESAARKCQTVALTWRSTEDFAAFLRDDLQTEPEYFHGMHHVGPIMTIGGGVPILVSGHLAGIAAVSGASTPDDIALAKTAARVAAGAVPGR